MTPWESPGGDKFLPLVESEVGEEIILETGKRRWAFTSRDILIQPYYKKTMMLSEPMLALTDSSRSIPAPRSLKTAFDLDFIWMVSLFHSVPNNLIWTGWNSRIVKDVIPLQRGCYLLSHHVHHQLRGCGKRNNGKISSNLKGV